MRATDHTDHTEGRRARPHPFAASSVFSAVPLLFLALWLFPLVFLTWEAAGGGGRGVWWWLEQRAWQIAARTTIEQAAMVAGLGFLAGWLPGVLTGLAPRGWRWMIQGLCALPLLLPPFLWAVGWSFLQSQAPRRWYALFDGRWGMLCAGLAAAVPLVVLASSADVSGISRAQWELVISRRGGWIARWLAARRALPAAAGAAALAALLGASDAGAGQIMGRHGMAGEVLVSLAARQDPGEAATKSLAGAVLLLPLAALAAWMLTRAWRHLQSGRGTLRGGAVPDKVRLDWLFAMFLAIVALMALALPVMGFAGPLSRSRGDFHLREALTLWEKSLAPTLWYGLGGAVAAAASGLAVATLAARSKHRGAVLTFCLLALAVPSSLRALGWVAAGSHWSAARSLLGTEAGVAAALGLQWMPLAVLLLTPALAALPQSWDDRRRLAGVSRLTYLRRVLLPVLTPWLGVTIAATALLVLADVTSLMLLQPPGRTAFTSHVFAVMDNSMEAVVASLCVALIVVPLILGLLLLLCAALAGRMQRHFSPAP